MVLNLLDQAAHALVNGDSVHSLAFFLRESYKNIFSSFLSYVLHMIAQHNNLQTLYLAKKKGQNLSDLAIEMVSDNCLLIFDLLT